MAITSNQKFSLCLVHLLWKSIMAPLIKLFLS